MFILNQCDSSTGRRPISLKKQTNEEASEIILCASVIEK